MSEKKQLIKGFKEFYNKNYLGKNACMPELVKKGAHPDFFIVHCIDPRSGADLIFNTKPGTLFGDRVMASLVPPYEKGSDLSASFSYAIEHKKIKHIIVLGHTKCGGIEALVNDIKDPEISGWMNKAAPALQNAKNTIKKKDKEALYKETEKQIIILSLDNLLTYPSVKKALDDQKITISGWLFNMEEGALYEFDPNKKQFANITSPPKNQIT